MMVKFWCLQQIWNKDNFHLITEFANKLQALTLVKNTVSVQLIKKYNSLDFCVLYYMYVF